MSPPISQVLRRAGERCVQERTSLARRGDAPQEVASGRYQQAQFAADLRQVHLSEGTDQYTNPVEFFRRAYLTESLKQLRVNSGVTPGKL